MIAPETETDVLIVGAGPTGLVLATLLQRAGIDHVIVDKLAEGQNTSRAAVLHAHTLDVLECIDAPRLMKPLGLTLRDFSIRDRDRRLLRLPFDDLPSAHSYLLMIPQDQTERVLEGLLADAGGRVRRGCEVQSLTRTERGARAIVASASGATWTVDARYVVGADGMRSIVRQAAGIGFTGTTYEDSFVLADVDMSWGLGRSEVMLFFSPAGLLVVVPLPGTDRFRLVATMADPPERPTMGDIQALVDARGPTKNGGRITNVVWSSRFRVHHRVADHYRNGPFLLVGDAAHVHSPAGGQGMNTGLVDACVLGSLLCNVMTGRATDTALDGYETRRRPAAASVLKLAHTLTSIATVRGAAPRLMRNLALRIVGGVPVLSRKLKMNLSGLSRRAAAFPHGG
jgi:2-polyprenyl-6-methoxyphenol hydroxylase-like FAD-dependent oxidoreductase